MDKIKVCHIITKLELGGAQGNTLYTVAHLHREEFVPVLIAGRGGVLDSEAEKLSGVKVHFVHSLVRRIHPLRDLLSLVRIYRLLRHEKPAIVHTHSSKAGILGRWAAKLAGVPVIIHTFHGFAFHDYQRRPVRLLYVLLERLTRPITGRFIAVAAEDIKKGIRNAIGAAGDYTLIRSGIDVDYYKNLAVDRPSKRASLGIAPDAKVVTTIGPFKPQKNLKDYLAVARRVTQQVPGAVFLVVGDGVMRADLERTIAEFGLGNSVRLLGWRRDVGEILAASDIFVLTSLWEGLPRAVLEAMSCGLPVVANAVDGTREIVQDGVSGYLVQPLQAERMADLVAGLLRDPSRAAGMGKKGRDLIDRQFDIRYMVEQQEQLYKTLLHTR